MSKIKIEVIERKVEEVKLTLILTVAEIKHLEQTLGDTAGHTNMELWRALGDIISKENL